jgi:hypothetical protein
MRFRAALAFNFARDFVGRAEGMIMVVVGPAEAGPFYEAAPPNSEANRSLPLRLAEGTG